MKQNILFVASEAVPFIKTGGLADVVGALPKYFDPKKYDVRIILPKYRCIDEKLLTGIKPIGNFEMDLNWRKQYVGILQAEADGVVYYFIDNEYYFAGDHPYNNIYEDVEKFAYFSKAVLAALPLIGFCPRIIHCNDWQTGLVPVFLHTLFDKDSFYSGIKTVFSIHNLQFQGRWRIRETMDITGLPESLFNSNELEAYGEANYLKGGCVYADAISTVSPTYARDICTPEGGEGLHGLMECRRNSLYGILNGIDYRVFDPQRDPYLTLHREAGQPIFDWKAKNKKRLQGEFGLPMDPDVMLVGIVSRLTTQKGFDLIAYIMEELLSTMSVQIVVLGTGESNFENMFHYFQNRFGDKLGTYIGYSEKKAHDIYAGCDAFLMPSLFEPCGLSQMIAMHYGTVPIVRETGGLKDTVPAYNEYENTGLGFSFANYNAHELLHTLRYAASVFYDHRKEWNAMVERDLAADFSWSASALAYERMYEEILGKSEN